MRISDEGVPAEHFVAERYWPGATTELALASMERLRASSECLAARGVQVLFRGGMFAASDEAVSCRFEGSAAAVRAVHLMAQVPLDRLLPIAEVEPSTTAFPRL